MIIPPGKKLVLFDGICNLCNRSVQFIIKNDKKQQFLFASLQGNKGQEILKNFNLPTSQLHSFVLVDNKKVYTQSAAALRIANILGGGWKLFYGLMIIPPFIRNGVYKWIARNRYKWFGKKDDCMIPTPDVKERFLD